MVCRLIICIVVLSAGVLHGDNCIDFDAQGCVHELELGGFVGMGYQHVTVKDKAGGDQPKDYNNFWL